MQFLAGKEKVPRGLTSEILGRGEGLQLSHSSVWEAGWLGDRHAIWSSSLDSLQLVQTAIKGVPSILQASDTKAFASDVKAWISLRERPGGYITSPVPTLLPEGGVFDTVTVLDPKQKEDVRSWILDYASGNGNRACAESAHSVFEELFMNATLDAPAEAKEGRFQGQAVFSVGRDDTRIAVSCLDSYGSLRIPKLLSRMEEVYRHGAGQMIRMSGKGGAGIGCTILMENCSLICFGVWPGRATAVTCLIPRHLTHRQRTDIKKSLHLVTIE